MRTGTSLAAKLASLLPQLDERARRLVAAAEAKALPRGGVTEVHRSSGLSRTTITAGMRELRERVPLPAGRIRRAGAGRKRIEQRYPKFMAALDRLVAPFTRGDPESPLRWTCKSTRGLAAEVGGDRVAAS